MMVIASISNLFGKVTILVMVGLCVNTAAALDGSGTQQDPWRIQSLEDFNEFAADANYWEGFTRLETDANLAGMVYERAVIAPDTSSSSGFQGTAFTGVFDGNDHKITNLTIKGSIRKSYLGLFGLVDNGEARNLGLEGGSVSGTSRFVGGLVGFNAGSVTNCYSNSSVKGYSRVGGLIGYNFCNVSGCYSDGSVVGDVNIGGLVGANSGALSKCYSTCFVIGGVHVGGLVGWGYGSHSSIAYCYFTGSVSGNQSIGGIVGANYRGSVLNCYSTGDVNGVSSIGGLAGENGGSVSNCYSTGDVNGVSSIGGLMGYNYHSVSNSFWDTDTQTHGVTESIGLNEGTITNISGLTTTQMQMGSTFTNSGWDFVGERYNGTTETWQMPDGGGYPVLSFFYIDIPAHLDGSGTEDQPYLVSDANELGMVSWYPVDCYFKLTRDIDLSGINWSGPLVPSFSGCFDGNNCIISIMKISGGGYLGMFGFLRDQGRIINLFLDGGSVIGNGNYVGGLVSLNWDGFVSNCYSTGDISGGETVGGLMGFNGGSVLNCYSIGDVNGLVYVGGLMGFNFGNVSNCYSSGTINGGVYVGGLVGYNLEFGKKISNCYSTGNINGDEYIGGLVGRNYDYISHCYSTCYVNGGACVGGLVGDNSWGNVSNCYSIGDVNGISSVGGLVGDNSWGHLSNCYSTGDVNGVTSVGGLTGINTCDVTNCYSTGCASGNERIGGLVGQNGRLGIPGPGHVGHIYTSYSTGRVQGDSLVGGLVGYHVQGDVEASFWDIDNSGTLESDGGMGKTTGEMQTKSTFTDVGWDFVDIWDLTCEGMNYPRFIWEIPSADFLCPDGVNFIDYSFFASHWLEDDCSSTNDCEGADLDQLGSVDANDLAIFVESWLTGIKLIKPAQVSNPNPPDGATDVNVIADLSWSAGSGATSYDVYFGTSSPGTFRGNQTDTIFDPGTMAGYTKYYWRIDSVNSKWGSKNIGTVWSFTTLDLRASNPDPPDGAIDVNVIADLSWSPGPDATSYDVYFGTSSPGTFQGNQTNAIFDPGTMAGYTTYYWRIDSVNSNWGSKTIGTVWSFTTLDLRASNPNPPDGSIGVSTTADLSWTAGPGAISHDVYFGTSNPPPFICNQSLTIFNPGTMASITTYYWRIDEINTEGKINGLVWSFTTFMSPPPP